MSIAKTKHLKVQYELSILFILHYLENLPREGENIFCPSYRSSHFITIPVATKAVKLLDLQPEPQKSHGHVEHPRSFLQSPFHSCP